MKNFYLLISLVLLSISTCFSQAGISTATNYTQNFDALGSDGIATLPLGWKVEKMIGTTAQRVVGTYSNAVNVTMYKGGANMSATAKNGIYNFGAGDSITATDRALGGSTTGSLTATQGVNFYLHLKNTGSANISKFTISYDIEKYRYGANSAGFCMQMYTSTDGVNWTSAGTDFYTFFAADATTAGDAIVPIQTVSVSKTLPIGLVADGELYLGWNYSVASGNSSPYAQQLAVDNVVINGSPTTSVNSINLPNISFSNGILTVFNENVQSISVIGINGSKLMAVNNSNSIDLNVLKQGIYLINILNIRNEQNIIKIMR